MTDEELICAAVRAMGFSYSPYSHFSVGAALLCADGSCFTGCNIENGAYSPSVCAERTAVFKAVSEGKRDFSAIAIVGGPEGRIENLCPPCGVCRQVLSEFCHPDMPVILSADGKTPSVFTLSSLLPLSFKL